MLVSTMTVVGVHLVVGKGCVQLSFCTLWVYVCVCARARAGDWTSPQLLSYKEFSFRLLVLHAFMAQQFRGHISHSR